VLTECILEDDRVMTKPMFLLASSTFCGSHGTKCCAAVLISIAFAVLVLPARAEDNPAPPGVKAIREIQFAQPNGKPLCLDLFVPEKADRPLPLIIWVHGGAWSAGHKEWQPIPALPMTARGYAVATIDYRLSGVVKWPAQIFDCKAAVRFLRAHA
jgi:acetyl esterase/lipase